MPAAAARERRRSRLRRDPGRARGTSTSTTRSSAASSSTGACSPRWRIPADYGFVEGTLAEDGDPLDALVLVSDPTFPGCRIRVRPIGVFHMTDEKGPDEKVLCVPLGDPSFERVRDIHDVNAELRDEIEHFFQRYKDLEPSKLTETRGWGNRSEAGDPRRGPRARASMSVARADRPAAHGRERTRRRATCSTPTTARRCSTAGRRRLAALKAGLAARGLAADRHPPSAAHPHPPRPRGRRGRARPRAPRAAGARLRDRRAAPRRPGAARAQRAPALRRRVRRRSGASSRPCRRRTCTSSATASSVSSASRRRGTRRITSRTSTATARSTRATRPACASSPAAYVMPPTPPPDVDVDAWERDDRRDRAARARAARADPLRRRRRRPARTSPSCASSCSTGRSSSSAARPRRSSSSTAATELADAGEDARRVGRARCRSGSRTRG